MVVDRILTPVSWPTSEVFKEVMKVWPGKNPSGDRMSSGELRELPRIVRKNWLRDPPSYIKEYLNYKI